jgi:hypothetical protein
VRWSLVRNGLIVAAAGVAAGVLMANFGLLGGSGTALFLLPWFAVLGGLSWAAAGLLSR